MCLLLELAVERAPIPSLIREGELPFDSIWVGVKIQALLAQKPHTDKHMEAQSNS